MMLLSDGEEILIDLMRSLIDGGADVNIKDREGKTALFYATECGTYKIASFLLEYGINPNLTDIQGKTALEYAKESSILPREIRAKYHDHMIQILSGTSKLI
jgi:ankyrin repeat protein